MNIKQVAISAGLGIITGTLLALCWVFVVLLLSGCGKDVRYAAKEYTEQQPIGTISCATKCDTTDAAKPPKPKKLKLRASLIQSNSDACISIRTHGTKGWISLGCQGGPYYDWDFTSKLKKSGDCQEIKWRVDSGSPSVGYCFEVISLSGETLKIVPKSDGKYNLCVE